MGDLLRAEVGLWGCGGCMAACIAGVGLLDRGMEGLRLEAVGLLGFCAGRLLPKMKLPDAVSCGRSGAKSIFAGGVWRELGREEVVGGSYCCDSAPGLVLLGWAPVRAEVCGTGLVLPAGGTTG